MLESTDNINKNSDVFISYCSAQREYADCLRKMLTERGVKCWMAPYSIPTGSSYQTEIPSALSNTPNVLLVLSKEAETSRWVQKEWQSVGDPLWAYYGYVCDGIFKDEADVKAHVPQASSQWCDYDYH